MIPHQARSIASAPVMTVVMATFLEYAPAAAAQDAGAGERIWAGKAECPQCHGWAGDGFAHNQGASSLRKTRLARDRIRETIQCGPPGTLMPHFDRFAYTDKRCYFAWTDAARNGDRLRRTVYAASSKASATNGGAYQATSKTNSRRIECTS
jgi:hypothetical protein